MRLNKIFIVSLVILAILTVGAVSASDNVTSDDLSSNPEDFGVQESSIDDDLINIGDDSDDGEINEEIEENDNILSNDYDDIISVEENDANTIIGKEVTNDEPVLTSTDKEVLSDLPKKIKITILKQTGKTAKDKKIYFKITHAQTGEPQCEKNIEIDYECIRQDVYDSNKGWIFVSTNSKGIGVFKWSDLSWTNQNREDIGVWNLYISLDGFIIWDDNIGGYQFVKSNDAKTKVSFGNVKQTVVIKPKKLSTSFKSGKYFKAKVINSKTKKPAKNVKIILKVYTGKKAKTVTLTSNSKGLIKYSSSKLKVGKHKVVLKVKKSKKFKGKTKKSSIIISKAKLKISSPKVAVKYKKSKLFKVTVKNKKSGKPVKGIKVIMKVYTGKKYKKIVHKTNKKGKTGFNTKTLSKGKHKVVVVIKANSKYKKATAKSSVTVKKPKTTKSKSSKSKSSKSDKGKIKTKIYFNGYFDNKFHYVPTGSGSYVGMEYPYVSITPILRGADGKELSGKYKATVKYYWMGNDLTREDTFKGKFGKLKEFKGASGHYFYRIVIKYGGNSKYRASTFTTPMKLSYYNYI